MSSTPTCPGAPKRKPSARPHLSPEASDVLRRAHARYCERMETLSRQAAIAAHQKKYRYLGEHPGFPGWQEFEEGYESPENSPVNSPVNSPARPKRAADGDLPSPKRAPQTPPTGNRRVLTCPGAPARPVCEHAPLANDASVETP